VNTLLVAAVRLVVTADFANVGLMVRKLRVGYGQASALLDRMHELGIVGGLEGVDTRTVLLPLAEALAVADSADVSG
jgi:DNA segregation ATPase FtsK/SpoIIIE-like protein